MAGKKPTTHWDDARQYAEDVTADSIPACKWVKLACQRQLDDLIRPDFEYRFDPFRANKVCDFIEKLPHIKGKWETANLQLQPWQKFILCVLFGWVHKETRLRRFRTCYTEVARKNGKSALSSGVGLYMLTKDGEEGAEVYSAATTRDQAKIVFQVAQQMARKERDLRDAFGLQVNAQNLNVLATNSKFEALSSDSDTLDGLNVHCAIIDELHAHKTREVWDVIETATGARQQPLVWAITTAGSNKTGICYEQRSYVTKILEGVFVDETYFGIIFTSDESDDWTAEETWKKANPNYGVSVYPDDLRRKATKAMQMPSAVNNFRMKHLDVWANADVGLFDMLAWDACADPKLKPEQFVDYPCWMGIDLGFVSDIAAVVKVFQRDDKFYFFGRYYLPEEAIEESRNSQYSGWLRMGRIIETDGKVTDTEQILDDLLEDFGKYKIRDVAFDPYNELTLLNPMQKRGVSLDRLVKFPQTVPHMSPATEALMKAIRSRDVAHDGCPVMAWALSNVVGHFDVKGNVYPRKERPENKIDPAIAAIMAHSRAAMAPPGSVYEMRGPLILG